MSRNIDKANSTLAKYQEQQANEGGGYKDYSRYKRPKPVSYTHLTLPTICSV